MHFLRSFVDKNHSLYRIREWLSEYLFFAIVFNKLSVNCNNLDWIYSNLFFLIKASFHNFLLTQNIRRNTIRMSIWAGPALGSWGCLRAAPQRPQVWRPLYKSPKIINVKIVLSVWFTSSHTLLFTCTFQSHIFRTAGHLYIWELKGTVWNEIRLIGPIFEKYLWI